MQGKQHQGDRRGVGRKDWGGEIEVGQQCKALPYQATGDRQISRLSKLLAPGACRGGAKSNPARLTLMLRLLCNIFRVKKNFKLDRYVQEGE